MLRNRLCLCLLCLCLLAAVLGTGCDRRGDLVEFGDGQPLELVAQIGRPGPTPTDMRPGGVIMQLWFRNRQGDQLVGCRHDGSLFVANLATKTESVSGVTTTGVCDYAEDADRVLVRRANGEVIVTSPDGVNVQRLTGGDFEHGAIDGAAQRAALTRGDNTIEIWQIEPAQLLRTIEATTEVRNGLAISADGSTVAAAEGIYRDGHSTRIEVWQIDTGELVASLDDSDGLHLAGVWGLSTSHNGHYVAAGSQRASRSGLRVWSSDLQPLFERDNFHSYWVRGLALSEDGTQLAMGDERGNLVLFDVTNNEERAFARPNMVVQSVAISPDGKTVAAGLWNSQIGVWRLPKAEIQTASR